MKNRAIKKLEAITPSTLVVGVDIAKETQWARFVDYRGLELGKALKFHNDKNGFEIILASIETICKSKRFDNVIVGMEPTGHYWKPLAYYLIMHGIKVVMVNPYHTKRAKELDDNSQTKSDKKDALTIAKLVRDGRYYEIRWPCAMVAVNSEMKELYKYLKTRPNNPLKKKQALVVISKKIITVIYNLVKKQTEYKAELVFGEFRKNQIKQAA